MKFFLNDFKNSFWRRYQFVKKIGLINSIKIFLLKKNKKRSVRINLSGYKNSLYLRANTSDLPTFEQIFINEDYNIKVNFEPKLIIDAGAYVGFSSVYFANRFPAANIIALEPAKSNYTILQRNTIRYDNITAYNKGLWSKKSFLNIVNKGYGDWGFWVEEAKSLKEADVEAVSVNDILEVFHFNSVDILKLDIEGSETEVFSENYETWLRNVKLLIIELHDRIKPGCSDAFFNAVKPYNFTLSSSGENIVLINDTKNYIK